MRELLPAVLASIDLEVVMEQIYERCCALDVHKATVSACVRVPDRSGARTELKGRFSTMTSDLLALRDWLVGLGVRQVAMEGYRGVLEAGLVRARGRVRAGLVKPGARQSTCPAASPTTPM